MRYFEKIAVRDKEVEGDYRMVQEMVQDLRQIRKPKLEIVQRPEREMAGEMLQDMELLPNRRASAADLWIPEAATKPAYQGNQFNVSMQDYLKKYRS